jgi:anaerobic selenocysteine-containing dehydrogenase
MTKAWIQWVSVPCRYCGAPTGIRCRTVNGLPAPLTHSARHKDFRRDSDRSPQGCDPQGRSGNRESAGRRHRPKTTGRAARHKRASPNPISGY